MLRERLRSTREREGFWRGRVIGALLEVKTKSKFANGNTNNAYIGEPLWTIGFDRTGS
jgi:hypothetical protein